MRKPAPRACHPEEERLPPQESSGRRSPPHRRLEATPAPAEKPEAAPAEKPNPFEKKKEEDAAKAARNGDLAKGGVDAEVLKVLAGTQKTLAKLAADNAVL